MGSFGLVFLINVVKKSMKVDKTEILVAFEQCLRNAAIGFATLAIFHLYCYRISFTGILRRSERCIVTEFM